MKKNAATKFNREQATKMIEGNMDIFLKKAQEAKQFIYVDLNGKEYRECAGAYNDYLVRAMSSDMSKLWVQLNITHNEFADEVATWSTKLQELNYAILRQMDDYNGDRPIVPLIKDGGPDLVKELLESMTKVKKSGILDNSEFENVKNKMDMWVDRVLYITSWAYYIEQMISIEDTRFDVQIKAYDDKNNLIFGIKDNDRAFVETTCKMREILLKAFLRIPVRDKESKLLLEKLNFLDVATQATMQGKLDKFIALLSK